MQCKGIDLNLCVRFYCSCLLGNREAIFQKVCHDFEQEKSCTSSSNHSLTYSINTYETNHLSSMVLTTGHRNEQKTQYVQIAMDVADIATDKQRTKEQVLTWGSAVGTAEGQSWEKSQHRRSRTLWSLCPPSSKLWRRDLRYHTPV